jgi:GxxExxY protein
MHINDLSRQIIGCAMRIHSQLGLGLLESAYEECMAYELSKAGLPFEKQKGLPLVYETVRLDCGHKLDFLVASQIIIEIKSVDAVHDVHVAQVLTYLKLSRCPLAILINFNVAHLRDGIRRFVL